MIRDDRMTDQSKICANYKTLAPKCGGVRRFAVLASTARNWHSAGPHGLKVGSEASTDCHGKAAYQHDGG